MPKLPVGVWVEQAVDYLLAHFSGLFDGLSGLLQQVVNAVYLVLVRPHPAALLGGLVALAWLASRRWQLVLTTALGFLLVQSMGLWLETMQTLAVVLVASCVAVVIGLPVGILAARNARVSVVARPVLDFMQTLPVFVYLLPAVFFFGIGVVPGVVATTVFAIPPAVRLTELGIRQVDAEVVEAALAFGSRPRQVLLEVQLPLALPSIMAGINQVIMLALSMVVIAGLVGGGALGAVVVQAVTQLDIGRGFEGGLAVVILAIYLDRVTASLGARAAKGRRRQRRLRVAPEAHRPAAERLQAA